jgi:hypothetical protein
VHALHDLHLAASTPDARYLAVFSDDRVLNFRRLGDTQPEPARRTEGADHSRGPGFRFDERALDRYAADRYAADRYAADRYALDAWA